MLLTPTFRPSRRRLLLAALATATALGGCALRQSRPAPAAARSALAPTGALRVAVYAGSPTSLVEQAPPQNMRGVSV
ncbi:MAG TPA: hypothetical protein VIL30_22270, partial [Ramlibacter sp.]